MHHSNSKAHLILATNSKRWKGMAPAHDTDFWPVYGQKNHCSVLTKSRCWGQEEREPASWTICGGWRSVQFSCFHFYEGGCFLPQNINWFLSPPSCWHSCHWFPPDHTCFASSPSCISRSLSCFKCKQTENGSSLLPVLKEALCVLYAIQLAEIQWRNLVIRWEYHPSRYDCWCQLSHQGQLDGKCWVQELKGLVMQTSCQIKMRTYLPVLHLK